MHVLRLCAVFAASLLTGFAGAQTDLVQNLKAGDRVTVDIAGYTYQATFTGMVPCRDADACVAVTDDDGHKKTLIPRFIKPPVAGSGAKAQANLTSKPSGVHTCSAFGGGQLMTIRGFTLKDNGTFTDHGGSGRWTWDAVTSTVTFSGGAWNGQKARKKSNGSLNVLRANGEGGATSCSRS